MDSDQSKRNLSGTVLVILGLLSVLCSGWGRHVQEQAPLPLLLSSGQVTSQFAEVRMIVWFDNAEKPYKINLAAPLAGWTWQEKAGASIVQLTGAQVIDAREEMLLSNWYSAIEPQVRQAGGRMYLDERIAEGLDIAAYLAKTDALPQQWDLTGKTRSIAAWHHWAGPGVWAGTERINLQLATRMSEQGGMTVLAVPVLVEEF
ncbi:MAG: hypothetical protein LBT32_02910 [Peptococcaceae bacterium]|jgi:hypothetical protein|nr:hypothetical protein [Peptococcaceae bacterium]